MNLFNSNSKSPTKMFINLPNQASEVENPTRSLSPIVPGGIIADMLINAAPKLIEEGMELISATINKFAQKDVTKTIVKRNIDIRHNTQISIPNSLTIIRGEFAPVMKNEGKSFGDGETQQTTLIGDEELHIEIDILKSEDEKSIYFQPTKYFYNGIDREGDEIYEIVLACAFIPVNTSTINVEPLKFQTLLHFEHLKPQTQYNFKSEEGYDSSYQSSWMQPDIDPKIPYTLLIEIQEIREGNSFAKLLQTVYSQNRTYIKEELDAKIRRFETLKNEEKISSENQR